MSEGVTLTVLTFHPRPWQQQQQRLVSYIISVYLLCTVQTMTPYGSVKDIIVSSSRSLLFEMRRGSRSIAPPVLLGSTHRAGPSFTRPQTSAECPISNALFCLLLNYLQHTYSIVTLRVYTMKYLLLLRHC